MNRFGNSESDSNGPQLVDQVDNLLLTSLPIRCPTACIDAACELIELIASTSHTNTTGAWWYNIFCKIADHPEPIPQLIIRFTDLFTSAMVLLLTDLSSSVQDSTSQSSMEISWQRCLEALGTISSCHTEAKQCAKTLGLLRKQVSTIIERTSEIPNTSRIASQTPTAFQPFSLNGGRRNMDMTEYLRQAGLSYDGVPNLNFDFDADDIQLNQMLNLKSGIFPSWNVDDMSSWGVPVLD